MFSLVLIHETGHFMMALLLNIEVDKIYLYPFGGISKFNMDLNEKIINEFLVLIMGPIFQIIGYRILISISFFYSYLELIRVYHYTILFFNLLPIYPLDGGRLVCLLLSIKVPYKSSLKITIYLSCTIVFILFLYNLFINIQINTIVLFTFLVYKIKKEYNSINYIYEKFILERYLNKYPFKKRKVVNNVESFLRGKYHIIKKGKNYITEKSFLKEKFTK